jgi:hypothetical protein
MNDLKLAARIAGYVLAPVALPLIICAVAPVVLVLIALDALGKGYR